VRAAAIVRVRTACLYLSPKSLYGSPWFLRIDRVLPTPISLAHDNPRLFALPSPDRQFPHALRVMFDAPRCVAN